MVTKRVNAVRRTPGAALWQRNYYERIIRNEDELRQIREYAASNPVHWAIDRENEERTGEAEIYRWLYGKKWTPSGPRGVPRDASCPGLPRQGRRHTGGPGGGEL